MRKFTSIALLTFMFFDLNNSISDQEISEMSIQIDTRRLIIALRYLHLKDNLNVYRKVASQMKYDKAT